MSHLYFTTERQWVRIHNGRPEPHDMTANEARAIVTSVTNRLGSELASRGYRPMACFSDVNPPTVTLGRS